jgi:arylsulfatase A-like enzyme
MKLTKRLTLTAACLSTALIPPNSIASGPAPKGLAPAGPCAPADGHPSVPPAGALNVLVIVLDDLGTDQLRMYGTDTGPPQNCAQTQVNTTPTPTLDVLKLTGVRFSRAYVNPLCSPTRAALLTGRYGMRTGVGAAIDRGTLNYTLPSTEMFLPELIRDYNTRSYARGAFGKWHVADIDTQDAHAAQNGFETYKGAKGNLTSHFTWRKVTANGGEATSIATSSSETVTPAPGTPPSEETYDASVNRRDAVTWINAQTKPFFAYVCFNPPHLPFQVPPTNLLSKKTQAKLASLGYETGESPAPGVRTDATMLYHAGIEAIDREIFELLLAIAPKLPRTMIVIVGDNGTPVEGVEDVTLSGKVKRSLYEMGSRVPLLITGPLAWPNAGQTCRRVVSGVDLWRTVANFTGMSNSRVDNAIAAQGGVNDSLSLIDLLQNPQGPGPRTIAYSELFPNGTPPIPPGASWLRGMSDGNYRYMRRRVAGTITEELYDLAADPCNLTNLLLPSHVLTPAESAARATMSAAMDAL